MHLLLLLKLKRIQQNTRHRFLIFQVKNYPTKDAPAVTDIIRNCKTKKINKSAKTG